jgi:hypothetical protein
VTLLTTPAGAQSATEDGIRAMLRGDYPTAVRILRPLADDGPRRDPVAQFFLAVLYDTGHGVKRDEGRACGLFLRAANGASPFAEQAGAIGASMREQLGGGASMLCLAEERWQGGPPQSFVLGPDHRIVFADTSVTVTYGDQEQRTIIVPPPGGAFLPIQYTPLAVTSPVAARRHFFEWCGWVPDAAANPASWTMWWVLTEVVGDQWIALADEKDLVVVNGPTRPATYDVTSRVRLRVNAKGLAEFTILGGSSPRTQVIPVKGNR